MSPRKRKIEYHESVREEIKETARKLMGEKGTAGLSIRAIAREMEITAPALYHYYDNLDALITDLILDSFNNLADTLLVKREQCPDGAYQECIMDLLREYRQWALSHPTDFELIYGNPIPGYEAPAEITMPASARTMQVISKVVVKALEAGEMMPPKEFHQVNPKIREHLAKINELRGFDAPIEVYYISTLGWIQIHGFVMLELFGHLEPVVGDIDQFFENQLAVWRNQMSGISATS